MKDNVQRLIIQSEWLRDGLLEVRSSSEKLAILFFLEDHARTHSHIPHTPNPGLSAPHPLRTRSAPAPIAPFRPRPLSRAPKSPSFPPPDSALEELLEIFSSSPSLSAGGTPHRASSKSARTILPSRASGVRSRGPGYGRESVGHAHGHGHGRKRSSGEGLGAGSVGGAFGGRRTPPVVWFDRVAYSPPSRALTRNPFIRHAQSAIPILHVPHGESPESEGSVLAI